jgi:hypothetical protein
MKKFSDISDKNSSLEFKKDKAKDLSNDIDSLDDQLSDEVKSTILDGEWQIDSILSISSEAPTEDQIKSNEAIVINAELGKEPVKRGDFIYITALINKRGSSMVHQSQMGVIKVRVVEIYNTLMVLNQLKR